MSFTNTFSDSFISPTAFGAGISCIVDVTLHLGNSKVIKAFETLMNKCDEVTQCYYVTGAYDFVVVVNTNDMQQYEDFLKTYLMDNPAVKQFYTHVVMHKLKAGYRIKI